MHVHLHHNLSYCRVDGGVIFLDIQSDRYFRLSNDLERSFLSCIEGDCAPGADVDALIKRSIVVAAPEAARPGSAPSTERPARSAVEEPSYTAHVPIGAVWDAFAIVCSTRMQLATRRLKDILTDLARYRRKHASQPLAALTEVEAQRLSDAATTFNRARPYVPIETRCLLDSISMVRFLAKRRLHANIVFGITGDPFSAHCWVQTGDLVLNETVGDAVALTPIRTI